MGNNDKEEEQLLQDASTLLMFANVAAKQQQDQIGHKASPTPPPSHASNIPQFHSNHQPLIGPQSPQTNYQQSITPSQKFSQLQSPLQQQPLSTNDHNSAYSEKRIQEKFQIHQGYINSNPTPTQSKSLPESSRSSISEHHPVASNMYVTESPYQGRGFPAHGNFVQHASHKRSLSSPGAEITKTSQNPPVYNSHSPGPANVTLSRGINIESGKRNNSNAMIAAAALAAAADIPLPLIKKGAVDAVEQTDVMQREEPSLENITKDVRDNDAVEESAMTEPEEEDVNKTDEEDPSVSTVGNIPSAENEGKVESSISESMKKEKMSELPTQDTPATAYFADASANATSIEHKEPTQKRDMKFRPPPLATYQVDPDVGTIGCICGIEDDDGFTVQCDICFRWQHCLCMDFNTNDEVPEDEYKCYYCDEAKWGKFNAYACRERTLRRLELDKMPDRKGNTDESKPPNKRKPSSSDSKNDDKKKRKAVDGNQEKTDKRKKANKSESSNSNNNTPINTVSQFLPDHENELLDNGISAESYQSIYYKLKSNDYKKPAVKELFKDLGNDFYKCYSQLNKQEQESCDIDVMSPTQFKAIKFSRIILENQQEYLQNKNESIKKQKGNNRTSIQVKLYAENQKQKFNGITRLGVFITDNDDSELRSIIPEGETIIEYFGELDLFENYKNDPLNQYSSWGITKPRVLKTTLDLPMKDKENKRIDIVSDSRFVGNEARFVRKSCPSSSNCKIKTVYVPQTNAFKYLIVTSKPITLSPDNNNEEELRLEWEWDQLHPINKMYGNKNQSNNGDGLKFDQFSEADKSYLITSVDSILHFVECGCCTSTSGSGQNGCAIFKVKKATSYLLRSTRKASSISNINLMKSREELVIPKKPRKFISWEERLIERDRIIQMNLHVTTEEDENIPIEGGELSENQIGDKKSSTNKQRHIKSTNNDSDSDSESASTSVFFSIPFKQQLIARGRKLANDVRFNEMKKEFTNVDGKDNEESNMSLSLSIPIVPELAVKIQKSLDREIEQLKNPDVKEIADAIEEAVDEVKVDAIPFKLSNTPGSSEAVIVSAQDSNNDKGSIQDKPIADIPKEESPTEPIPAPAPVVKKLSFADYKKKMK